MFKIYKLKNVDIYEKTFLPIKKRIKLENKTDHSVIFFYSTVELKAFLKVVYGYTHNKKLSFQWIMSRHNTTTLIIDNAIFSVWFLQKTDW